MNTSFFIARRYLFSKKTHNVINIISAISVTGIAVSSAALVIVLSAFNGIEDLVISLSTSFEPQIRIEAEGAKTFNKSEIPGSVYQLEGLVSSSEAIEEIAIFRNDDQFMIGTIKGVENSFLGMTKMDDHIQDGVPVLEDDYGPLALVGIGALQKLEAWIYPAEGGLETFTLYTPRKDQKISRSNASAFETSQIAVAGAFSFNNEVDDNYLLVPIGFAREIMNYGDQISMIELNFASGIDPVQKKQELSQMLDKDFKVTTQYERNQLFYQTSESEKWVTTLLLGFIFFLATFNMVASVTMLVLEKKSDLMTMRAMGARRRQLESVFFIEGMMINGIGLALGLLTGYLICWIQMNFGIITMEGSHAAFYPVSFKIADLILILAMTIGFGFLASWVPGRFLIRRVLTDSTERI